MKNKVIIIFLLLCSIVFSIFCFIFIKNETSEINKLPSINESYQETWQNIDYNILNYIKLSGAFSEIYEIKTKDSSFIKDFEKLNYQYKSTDNKNEKIEIYYKIIKNNEKIKETIIENDVFIKVKKELKSTEDSISLLIESYDNKINSYNRIINKPFVKIFFNHKYTEKYTLK